MAWDSRRFQRVGDGASAGVAKDKYGVRVVNYVRLREQKSGEAGASGLRIYIYLL